MIITEDKKILNVKIVRLSPYYDKRGFFSRFFCKKIFKKKNIFQNIKQINLSYNRSSQTFRGFHYQKKPFPEKKFIFCVTGKVQIGLVDLRKKSKTFLNCYSKIISSKSNIGIYVPEMVATSFLTLEPHTKIIYLMSSNYNSKYSAGLNYKDKNLNIKWIKKFKKISSKDTQLPFLEQ
jgi:dTDP-4-dehydrorhamnose 3,5-epimerase